MASKGNEAVVGLVTETDFSGARVVIVKTNWNKHITDALANGCRAVLEQNGIEVLERTVPGAVELTFGVQRLLHSNENVHACIALGCVIRGGTPHFEYVCQSVTQGITMLNALLKVPVIFGVLTVDTEEQALERIGGKHGHKGEEAAMTAIQMIEYVRQSSL
jgi:6,7-dimethyl-8-ribityllumazine synthase